MNTFDSLRSLSMIGGLISFILFFSNIQSHLLFEEPGKVSYESLINLADKNDIDALNELNNSWNAEASEFAFIKDYLENKGYSKKEVVNKLNALKAGVPPMGAPKVPPAAPPINDNKVPPAPPMTPSTGDQGVPQAPPMAPPMTPPMGKPTHKPSAPRPGETELERKAREKAEAAQKRKEKEEAEAKNAPAATKTGALVNEIKKFINNKQDLLVKPVENKFSLLDDFTQLLNYLDENLKDEQNPAIPKEITDEKREKLENIFKILQRVAEGNMGFIPGYIRAKKKHSLFESYLNVGVEESEKEKEEAEETADILKNLWSRLLIVDGKPVAWTRVLVPGKGEDTVNIENAFIKRVKIGSGLDAHYEDQLDEDLYNKYINDIKRVRDYINEYYKDKEAPAANKAQLNRRKDELTRIIIALTRIIHPTEGADAQREYKRVNNILQLVKKQMKKDPEFKFEIEK